MVVGTRDRRAKPIAAGVGSWRAIAAALFLAPALLTPALAEEPDPVAVEAASESASAAAAPAHVAAPVIPPAINKGVRWPVYKESWGPEDEAGYQAFVQAIGRSDCASLEGCLSHPVNPYRDTDDHFFYGDCADMAYMLRAYYAWKNGLPFSYQNAMRTADGSHQDLRYSTSGNIVAGRRDAIGKTPISAPGFIQRIGGEVSTAMFRTDPESHSSGRLFNDFYPIEISREAVRPGAVAYDIYGHVGIVYDVLDDGRILIVASHPDNSVTRSVYGPNFMRAQPALGAGLKAWRPIRIEGGTRAADGSIHSGVIKGAPNESIPDFSLEQFFGNTPGQTGEWHYGEFHFEGRTLSYYDYVRRKLAAPGFAYDPVAELRHGLETICGAVMDRRVAVSRATDARVHLRPHPERLPPNIFGTFGLWEDYSTPSRDARLKVSFIELRRDVQRLYEETLAGDPAVHYEGTDIAKDLWEAFEAEKNACTFTYKRSDDTRVRLNLGHVISRIWDISFDPYNCPERRWGATGAELETCTDDDTKTRWYNAQRFLRYQAERTYDVRMDFTVDQLQPPMAASPEEGGLGADAPPDADIGAYLARINNIAVADLNAPPEYLAVSKEPEDLRPVFPAWHAKIMNDWNY